MSLFSNVLLHRHVTWLVSRPIDSPQTGGEIYTQKVIASLRSKDWVVDVVSLADLNGSFTKSYFVANLRLTWKLLIQKAVAPIIVEDFYMHPWLFLFNWAAKFVRRCQIVVLVQLFYHYQQKNAFWNAVDRLVASLFLRPAHLVFANSQATADECIRLGVSPERIAVVYPGCDFAGQTVAKQTPVSTGERIRLLTIANYSPRKGLHHLLEAMSLIRQYDPVRFALLDLQIAGDPNDNPVYTQRLSQMLKSAGLQRHVHLLGWCSRDRIKKLLVQSDIFIFPSLQEGFGMALAEAMYYRLPIIAYRAEAIPELVEDQYNGLLLEPGDISGLAEAILRLVREPEMRAVMGQRSKDRSRQFVHSWDEVGQLFSEALVAQRHGS